jgi:hypothetical protein
VHSRRNEPCDARFPGPRWRAAVNDLIYVSAIVLFFVAAALFVRGCARL